MKLKEYKLFFSKISGSLILLTIVSLALYVTLNTMYTITQDKVEEESKNRNELNKSLAGLKRSIIDLEELYTLSEDSNFIERGIKGLKVDEFRRVISTLKKKYNLASLEVEFTSPGSFTKEENEIFKVEYLNTKMLFTVKHDLVASAFFDELKAKAPGNLYFKKLIFVPSFSNFQDIESEIRSFRGEKRNMVRVEALLILEDIREVQKEEEE